MKASSPTGDPAPAARPEREASALAHFAALLGFVFPLGNVAGPLAVLFFCGGGSDRVARHARVSALWQGAASAAAGTVLVAGPLHGLDPAFHMLVIVAAVALSLAAGTAALFS